MKRSSTRVTRNSNAIERLKQLILKIREEQTKDKKKEDGFDKLYLTLKSND